MKTNIKPLYGSWKEGFALDKHTEWSKPLGENSAGHMQFDTKRTEAGEALYQLKYKQDWSQLYPLARCLADNIKIRFPDVHFVLPMPASTRRTRQPVTEIVQMVSKITGLPHFDHLLLKESGGTPLKNLTGRQEKLDAIGERFSVFDQIQNDGCWKVVVIDDIYHTGASLESACQVLRGYSKVNKIYVATLTRR
ncbi:amidophosphoribosyltransferase [Morganella morganii]|uniref:Amidophosphoribosyltransferase n=1 Tax=Morganella morganii TaxID=582 RepID=A0A433ZYA2_MORMO|nr:amidophosphoribosyltransferase [Morganella morganii]